MCIVWIAWALHFIKPPVVVVSLPLKCPESSVQTLVSYFELYLPLLAASVYASKAVGHNFGRDDL